jgi:hypothetical protein
MMLRDRAAARAMGRRAAALVRREFGLELTAARYARIYTELLEHDVAGAVQTPPGASRAGSVPDFASWQGS